MNYKYINGKYIFEKEGVYFSLTPEQAAKMLEILMDLPLLEYMKTTEIGSAGKVLSKITTE